VHIWSAKPSWWCVTSQRDQIPIHIVQEEEPLANG
jgi:hypothetical protein